MQVNPIAQATYYPLPRLPGEKHWRNMIVGVRRDTKVIFIGIYIIIILYIYFSLRTDREISDV